MKTLAKVKRVRFSIKAEPDGEVYVAGTFAYSDRIRTPVPIQYGHSFRRSLTPIPMNPGTPDWGRAAKER